LAAALRLSPVRMKEAMKLKVLGCSGGIGGSQSRTTSFLVDEDILVDCGTGVGDLPLEVLVRIDERPLSRWATDGVLVATPTGSTAYAFSAHGPVIWPELSALLLVPLSAHALFNRPLVLSDRTVVSIEVLPGGSPGGVVWCDGRRTTDVAGGMEIEARVGKHRLRLARTSEQPFVNRLVRKFGLPVAGWRGAAERDATHAQ